MRVALPTLLALLLLLPQAAAAAQPRLAACSPWMAGPALPRPAEPLRHALEWRHGPRTARGRDLGPGLPARDRGLRQAGAEPAARAPGGCARAPIA
jgi:hypothetical protein